MIKKIIENFEKNQFNILLYFGINFILLIVMHYNFNVIKYILKEITNILSIMNIEKVFFIHKNIPINTNIIIVILMIISVFILPYRIINKRINGLFFLICCIFSCNYFLLIVYFVSRYIT